MQAFRLTIAGGFHNKKPGGEFGCTGLSLNWNLTAYNKKHMVALWVILTHLALMPREVAQLVASQVWLSVRP